MKNEVAVVLEDLRRTTRRLNPDANATRFDLDQVEKAVAEREHSVARLRELTLQQPDAFAPEDVDELRRILAEGKRAAENLMDMRREGWTTATQLHKKAFVMKTFLRYGSDSAS
jgi:hypothetical protein